MLQRKNIALIIYSLGMGGAEKVLADLSIEFAKQHNVTLIIFDGSRTHRNFQGELVNLNLPSVKGTLAKLINLVKRTWYLRQFFEKQRFDHVISFMEHANFPAILASSNVIVSNHCNPKTFSRQEWLFAKYLYPRAKKVVAVSQAGETIFRQHLVLDNLTYLHNPIDLSVIHQKAGELVNVPNKPYLIALGRLCPEKNFAGLIDAFSQSKAAKTHQLLILGEGAERKILEQKIDGLGLQEKVILKGFCDNPYPYLKQSECLVLSSIAEGFPVAIPEALACSCPVIATRCETGPEEIIQHEKNGLLVPVNDVTALVTAIDRLLTDKQLYQTLKENASDSVKHLDISQVAQRWLAL